MLSSIGFLWTWFTCDFFNVPELLAWGVWYIVISLCIYTGTVVILSYEVAIVCIRLLFLFSLVVALSCGTVTETAIALNFAIDDVIEGFAVTWKREQAVQQELASVKGSLVIDGLSPNTLYMIDVTSYDRDGKETAFREKVSTNGKCLYRI